MSKYEQRDNSGSLFKNERKEQDSHPDYKGECMIDGQAYWMSAWRKTADTGRVWMSFSYKRKEARPEPPPRARDDAARARKTRDDDFDSVPF